jgi:protein involved in polysaccharide export with SLBB domain
MNRLSYVVVTVVLFLLVGCAHHGRVRSDVGTRVLTVYAGGAVNTPGKLELSRPFTVAHAIQQAGGLDQFEQDQNQRVVIGRKGSQDISVPRKDYASFTLEEGDGIAVPRH